MLLRRAEFSLWLATIDPAHLIFVDEFGLNLGMTRRYARAPVNHRAYASAPGPHCGNITLVFGLRLDGVVAPMVVPGAINTPRFEAYVHDNLATQIGPGDVVVWDNLNPHKAAAVRALVEAKGARVELLPAYSPDLTPIENAGSKVKEALRAAATRVWEDLVQAAGVALHAVTAQDARGFFQHAGIVLAAVPKARAPP